MCNVYKLKWRICAKLRKKRKMSNKRTALNFKLYSFGKAYKNE